jgi:hypothetical protein
MTGLSHTIVSPPSEKRRPTAPHVVGRPRPTLPEGHLASAVEKGRSRSAPRHLIAIGRRERPGSQVGAS